MRTTKQGVKKAIEDAQPKTTDELVQAIKHFRFRQGLAWTNIYYMGKYQGVRIYYFDSKNKKHVLPANDSVFAVTKENTEWPKTHVDAKGFAIRGMALKF